MKLQKIIFAAAAAAVLVFAASCKATGDTGGGDGGPPPLYLNFDPNGGEWAKSGDSEPIQVAQHHGLPLVLPRINQPSDEEAGAEWDEMNYTWTGSPRNGSEYIFLAWIDQEADPLPSGVDYDLTTYIQDQGWTDYNTTELIFDMESFPETLYALWMEPPEWGRYSVKFAKFADTSDPLNSTETALAQAIISTVEAKEENNYILASTDIPAIDGTVLRANYTRADTNWHKFDSQANPSTAAAAFDFSTAISGNTTFVAKWNPNSYTLNFSTNGDATDPVTPSTVTGVTYTYPATVTSIPSVTRPHYGFSGWKNGSDTLALGQLVTANKTYTAQWTGVTYTVTLHLNGGKLGEDTGVATRTVTYPSNFIMPGGGSGEAISHPNLDFYYWNTQADNSGNTKSGGASIAVSDNSHIYYAIRQLPSAGMRFTPETDSPWNGGKGSVYIPTTGWYKVELWGAQGGYAGNNTAQGGYGSYTSGEIYLNAQTTVHFYIGGTRIYGKENSSAAAYNGAGSGMVARREGTGGGATDLRLIAADAQYTDPSEDLASLNSRIMIAAGGGGANGAGGDGQPHNGGNAGGYTGYSGLGNTKPLGGSQIQGGNMARTGSGGNRGSFGRGGSVHNTSDQSAGGGGAGWFGGGSGNHDGVNSSGAGGSSFIAGHAGCVAGVFTDFGIWPVEKTTSGGDIYALNAAWFDGTFTPSAGADGSVEKSKFTAAGHIANGKYFKNTVIIDGSGYSNLWASGAQQLTQTQMPKPGTLNEYYPAGQGNEGAGAARITFMNPQPSAP